MFMVPIFHCRVAHTGTSGRGVVPGTCGVSVAHTMLMTVCAAVPIELFASERDALSRRARRRAQRLVDDPDGAVRYETWRIFFFTFMIRGSIPANEVEPYPHARE
ncbi:hypothetical protein N505_0101485 [Rhodococcus aetherivorans]|nr:hypothetical protein N505_0101485 [Rhodococcus aetherivorans]